MVSRPTTRTLVEATLRIVAVVIASLAIVVGIFQRTIPEALTIGVVVGVGYAVAAHVLL